MQLVLLKSKIHRACVTVADVEYEGSIEIPSDLMEAAGLWEGERVLVTSASKGGRLETYAQAGKPGTGFAPPSLMVGTASVMASL